MNRKHGWDLLELAAKIGRESGGEHTAGRLLTQSGELLHLPDLATAGRKLEAQTCSVCGINTTRSPGHIVGCSELREKL